MQKPKTPSTNSENKELKDYWEKAAENWQADSASPRQTAQNELYKKEFGGLLGGKRKVLDVGTGSGYVAALFAEADNDVTAVDFSIDMLVKAKECTKNRNFDVKLAQATATETPFIDDQFDVVVNRFLFWTLPEPAKSLNEWVRVTKPGGQIVIVELEGIRGLRKFMLQLLQGLMTLRKGEVQDGVHSGKIWEKLPFGPIDKRLTTKEWYRYLSDFPVDNIKVKDISYVDRGAPAKGLNVTRRFASYFQPKTLLVHCTKR